jgi:NACHT domain
VGTKDRRRRRHLTDRERIAGGRAWRNGPITLVLLLGSSAVTLLFAQRSHLGVAQTLIAVSVGGPSLATVYLAWATYRDSRAQSAALPLREIADQLALAVGQQWQAEVSVRRLMDPYPLPVGWVPADTSLSDDWGYLMRLATGGTGWLPPRLPRTWADGPSELAGQGSELAGVLEKVPTRRLIVVGPPGAGKTILMVRLVLDLLACRHSGDPVPVLASLASWNPADQSLRGWLAAQLIIDHPALAAAAPPSAGGQTRVEALLSAGLILPILDGLDEVSPSFRSAAIARINDSLRPGEPLVVTSRTEEFKRAVRPPDGVEVMLRGAAGIQLHPLELEAIGSYLRDASNPAGAARWEQVLTGLDAQAPLAHVLSNPQMAGLARVIYSSRPGEDTSVLPDPGELLGLADETAIERHLLNAFIVSAYRPDPASLRRWSGAQAEHWLVFIARHLQHLDTPELAWWQIPAALRRQRQTLALLGGSVVGFLMFVVWLALGLAHGLLAGPASEIRNAFLAIVILAAVPALVAAFTLRVREPRPPNWLYHRTRVVFQGRARHLMYPGRLFRSADVAAAASPISVLSRARTSAIIRALASGLFGLLATIAITHLLGGRLPLVVAAVGASYIAMLFAMTTAWGNFQLAHFCYAIQGKLPYSLFAFLEDAQRRGVLRRPGAVYQFRHVLLQDALADPARTPDFRRKIQALANWALENPEIHDAYKSVRAERSDIEQAVNSVATDSLRAGQGFTVNAAVRQTVLERIRLRLNELGRRSLFNTSLKAQRAPGLGAVLDPAHVVLTDAMMEVERLADSVSSASIGISGVRGVGKSTLIRWICEEKDGTRRLPTLGLYVAAPVEYEARDFLIHLYTRLCQVVLADDRLTRRQSDWKTSIRQHILGFAAIFSVIASVAAFFHLVFGHLLFAFWMSSRTRLWHTVAVGALIAGVLLANSYFRRVQAEQHGTPMDTFARERLRRLRYQITDTTGQTGAISGPFGLSLGGSRSRALTENQMTLPELVADYRLFAGRVVSSLQDLAHLGGPAAVAQVRLIVGIDEIDRIESAEHAEKFLNEIKAIFGVPYCVYVASLSADALATFERRAVTARTTFDTAFDAMVRIDPLNLRTARQLLERRAIGLPYPFVALCHVLSGGVPRELMRVARSVFDVRNSGANARQDEVDCNIIAHEVIARELQAIRQGLLPLAAQLAVPGAPELIELLDDQEWPTGNLENDIARMSILFSKTSDFADANAGAAAARICDSFAAGVFLFLTVQEVFSLRIDDVVRDLMAYDSMTNGQPNVTPALQLLVKARAVLAVNPSLAASRVRGFRRDYKLPNVIPVLVSQVISGEHDVDRSPRKNSSS